MLETMGMEAFAERARRELKATGETARRRTIAPGDEQLTAQKPQVGRMARDGLSNPEIGARLFISSHTVQYHLRKVFTKLGISSRSQLDRVLLERRRRRRLIIGASTNVMTPTSIDGGLIVRASDCGDANTPRRG